MAWGKAAVEAREQGRYDDALQLHLKFHREALAIEPALYGVRLSFALSDWLETARLYPPAMQALRDVRDEGVAALIAGNGTRQLFHDVRAINDALETRADTHALLVELAKRDLPFARTCAHAARMEILEAGDFELSAQLFDSFEAHIRHAAKGLNSDVARSGARPTHWRSHSEVYRRSVCTTLALLEGMERHGEAERLRALSLQLIEDHDIRADLEPSIVGGRHPRSDATETELVARTWFENAEDQIAQAVLGSKAPERAVAELLLSVALADGIDFDRHRPASIDTFDVRDDALFARGCLPVTSGAPLPFEVTAVVGPRGRMMPATRVTIGDRTFAPDIDGWRQVDGRGPAAS